MAYTVYIVGRVGHKRQFRMTKQSGLPDYRCRVCQKKYKVYSGTVFEGRQLRPEQGVLLVGGVLKGETAQRLAAEVGVCRQTVQELRRLIQASALAERPETPLPDVETETDEMDQNAGKKGSGMANRVTHRAVVPINNADMVTMRQIGHPLSARLGVKRVKSGWTYSNAATSPVYTATFTT